MAELCRLQAVLREAKPGSGQVAEALLQVAFPLRLPGLTAIMGRFTKSGQWAISLDIFDTLPALALPRDTTVCNAALAACMRGCLWQRAKQAFDLMIAQGVPLDNITYYTMLSVPRRRKLWRVTIDVRFCQPFILLRYVVGFVSFTYCVPKIEVTHKLR
jgi:pentatricopeptide repeat protein